MPIHADFANSLEAVANLAVRKIGETKQIDDLSSDTGSIVEAVNQFFKQVIREVQSEFRWPELIKSAVLEIPAAENDGTYQYTFPTDWLRPASNREQSYLVENNMIYTSVSENFPVRYIRYSANPAEWSALLVKCIYYRLALEICMPVTENITRYNGLLEEYEKLVFPRARQVASFDHENPKTRIAHGRYSRTRGGLSGGGADGFNRVIGEIEPGHDHDADYAALMDFNAHDHDADYAALVHDHDADYAALVHDHDADYAALVHQHAANVASAIKTDTFEHNPDTVPEWVNIPDLVVNITPSATDSLLRIRAVVYGSTNYVSTPVFLRVTRDNSSFDLADTPGNRLAVDGVIPAPSAGQEIGCCVIDLIVDALSTDETTLRIQLSVQSASYNGYINRGATDTDSTSYARCVSTLSVEEILQS